jgi:hypothetical protein
VLCLVWTALLLVWPASADFEADVSHGDGYTPTYDFTRSNDLCDQFIPESYPPKTGSGKWCRLGEPFPMGNEVIDGERIQYRTPFHGGYYTGWFCKDPDACSRAGDVRPASEWLQSYVLCEEWHCPCHDSDCRGKGRLIDDGSTHCSICEYCALQQHGHYRYNYACDLYCDYNYKEPTDIDQSEWETFVCESCAPVEDAVFVKIIKDRPSGFIGDDNFVDEFENCKFQCINGKLSSQLGTDCLDTCANTQGVDEWVQINDNVPLLQECMIDTCITGWALYDNVCHYCGDALDLETGQWPDGPIAYDGVMGCVPLCNAEYYQAHVDGANYCQLCETGTYKKVPSKVPLWKKFGFPERSERVQSMS